MDHNDGRGCAARRVQYILYWTGQVVVSPGVFRVVHGLLVDAVDCS